MAYSLTELREDVRALKALLLATPGGFQPPGAITAYGGATAPDGWLLCDGSAVSREDYADLFAALGEGYGVGDGSTTFNLPDLRGRFPLGKATSGTGDALGETGGDVDHTHSQPTHTHSVDPPNTSTSSDSHSHAVNIGSFSTGGANTTGAFGPGSGFNATPQVHTHTVNPPNTSTTSDAHSHTVNIGSFNSGADGNDTTGATSHLPPFQVFNYIIRT